MKFLSNDIKNKEDRRLISLQHKRRKGNHRTPWDTLKQISDKNFLLTFTSVAYTAIYSSGGSAVNSVQLQIKSDDLHLRFGTDTADSTSTHAQRNHKMRFNANRCWKEIKSKTSPSVLSVGSKFWKRLWGCCIPVQNLNHQGHLRRRFDVEGQRVGMSLRLWSGKLQPQLVCWIRCMTPPPPSPLLSPPPMWLSTLNRSTLI